MRQKVISALFCGFCILMLFFADASSTVMLSEDTWTQKTAMPQGGAVYGAVVIGEKIYAFGGYFYRDYKYFGDPNATPDSEAYVSTCGKYDPTTDKWTVKSAMPTTRINFAAVAYENRVYVMGGQMRQLGSALDTVEIYDPARYRWSQATPLNVSATNAQAFVVNDKIFLLGENSASLQVYDPQLDSWSVCSASPVTVSKFAAVALDGKIYVIGGTEAYSERSKHGGSRVFYRGVNATQIYDPTTDNWTFGPPLLQPVEVAIAGATTGEMAPKGLYVFGQPNGRGRYITQVFDLKSQSWTNGTSTPSYAYTSVVVVFNDVLYVIGGSYKELRLENPLADPIDNPPPPFPAANYEYIPFGYGNLNPIPTVTPVPTPSVAPNVSSVNPTLIITVGAAVALLICLFVVLIIKRGNIRRHANP
jgi:N-acetylneuraminic acid mutarotase